MREGTTNAGASHMELALSVSALPRKRKALVQTGSPLPRKMPGIFGC